MRQSWQTAVNLVLATPQSEPAGFGEVWVYNCFHGTMGACRWKPFWDVPHGAMKSMDVEYALCPFGARPNGHKPSNQYFFRGLFHLAFISVNIVSKKWLTFKQWIRRSTTKGNGIVQDFSRNTFGSSCAFLAYFSCCLCMAFHYCEK